MKRLEVLQIHHIRWLSRGKVMERLVKLMPTLLRDWELVEKKMYEMATIFQVKFFIHLLAYVIIELNKLNKKFQEDHVDITSIGTTLDITISLLHKRFIRGTFGVGAMHTSSFLSKTQQGTLEFADCTCIVHVHELAFESFPKSQRSGTLDDCIMLGKGFVMKVIDYLNARFTNLPIFNVYKFFSPCNFYEDMNDRDSQTRIWLTCLCEKFSVGGLLVVDNIKCMVEMDKFICTMYKSYPKKNTFGAWDLCEGEIEWFEGFPCLMQLWQAILFIPANTTVCERGFSKLNRIKNHDRSRISLKTLEMLMFISLIAPHALNVVDWNAIYDEWKEMKTLKPLSLSK